MFPWDLIGKMLLASVLGGLIGLERLWHGRPAGLRTDMIIALSSCLFTVISLNAFGADESSRVASQIVVGVGFLGAGTLFHQHHQKYVLGLTTASTIWLVAAIGMAVGVGMYSLAIAVTVMAFLFLSVLAPISDWLGQHAETLARRRGYQIVREEPRVHIALHGKRSTAKSKR